jgi:hypothetical protein
MEKFLEINPNEAQILNIGAGFDTIAFHLAERKNPKIRIFEADFSDLLLRKANLIVKSKELYSVLLGDDAPKPSLQSITTEYGYHFNQLHLISSDLHLPQDFIQSLLQAGFQVTTPTLIFTECVLVCKTTLIPVPHWPSRRFSLPEDLKRDAVVNLCTSVLDLFPSHSPLSNPRNEEAKSAVEELESGFQDPSLPQGGVVWLSYDMVHPNDTFGKMMRSWIFPSLHLTYSPLRQNLEVAGGFKVPGFTQYPDLASHSSRFLESGCEVARACTMLSIYTNLIPTNEKIRINRIEMLDEVEEWEMLMSHYCISLGIKGGSQIMRDTMVELIPQY